MSGVSTSPGRKRPHEDDADARPADAQWEAHEQQVLGFRPLGSRLQPPRSQVALVQRDSLLKSLLTDRRALVVVTAPAGYGKSVALAQWLAADPRPSAWLQLDEADNDPVLFLSYLALALEQVAPVDPAILDLLQLRTPPIDDRILPSMAAALSVAEPFVLALDDGHLLTSDTCWRLVATLLEHLPEGAQVAVGTRMAPALPRRDCARREGSRSTDQPIWPWTIVRRGSCCACTIARSTPRPSTTSSAPPRAGPPAFVSPCSRARTHPPATGCRTCAATTAP